MKEDNLIRGKGSIEDIQSEPTTQPLASLPNDIFLRILSINLPPLREMDTLPRTLSGYREGEASNPEPLSLHPSVVASRVCHSWREQALSSPLLWSTMDIKVPALHTALLNQHGWDTQVEKLAKFINVWTKRSGSCPLRVQVTYHSMKPTFGLPTPLSGNVERPLPDAHRKRIDACQSELVKALRRSTERWKEARFTMAVELDTHHLLSLLPLDTDNAVMPHLEKVHLSIKVRADVWQGGVWTTERQLGITAGPLVNAPTLQSLSLGGTWSIAIPSPVERSHPHLTDLDIGSFRPTPSAATALSQGRAIMSLALCPRLIRCSLFWGSDRDGPETYQGPILTMRHLTTLTLLGSMTTTTFASMVDLPALRDLTLIIMRNLAFIFNGGVSQPSSSLYPFLGEITKRVGDQLKRLSLQPLLHTDGTLPEDLVLATVERCQNLITLDIGVYAKRSILDKFLPGGFTGVGTGNATVAYCPKLEDFQLWLPPAQSTARLEGLPDDLSFMLPPRQSAENSRGALNDFVEARRRVGSRCSVTFDDEERVRLRLQPLERV